jgi:hypothetical protein
MIATDGRSNMTLAVCFKCGKMKFGALVPCPECGAEPQTDDDMAISFAMTDHHFDMNTLEAMGQRVAEGSPPRLDPHSTRHVMEEIEKLRPLMERMRRPHPPPVEDQDEKQ